MEESIYNRGGMFMGKKPNAANITHGLAQLGGGSKKDGGGGMMGLKISLKLAWNMVRNLP